MGYNRPFYEAIKLEPQQRAHSLQVLPDGNASRVGAKRKFRPAGQRKDFKKEKRGWIFIQKKV